MIVSLAHTLGLKVIAEGVEDDAQVHLLKELGCDQIQGYFISVPVPAQQMEALLRPGAEHQLRRRIAAA
jgi:EAL domain-containing protein (putative c-di-GMP-specific phosphodiesterase class I)